MAFKLREMLGNWGRTERNKINDNWKDIERNYGKVLDDSGKAVQIANTANNKSDNAVETANQANATADYVQSQLDNVTAEGDSSAEVVQARKDYGNLRERLDAENARVTEQLAHVTTDALTQVDALRGVNNTKFIAHRGVSGIAPENSMPAFKLAKKYGFWGVECDVRRTLDGVWIVIHDDTVDRTTDGTGRVDNMTYAQIQALTIDVGKNVKLYPNLKVPTLEEYLSVCKIYDLAPLIELCGITPTLNDNYESFVDLLRKYDFESTAIVISFSKFYLQGIRNISRKIPMQLIGTADTELIENAVRIGNCDVSTNYAVVTSQFVDIAHQRGLKLGAWTVNDYTTAVKLLNWSVDFITSDKIPNVEV